MGSRVSTAPGVTSVAGRSGVVTLTPADVPGVETTANKDQPSGYAGLDANTRTTETTGAAVVSTDVTATRAVATTYTNNTGRRLLVLISVSVLGGTGAATTTVTYTCNGLAARNGARSANVAAISTMIVFVVNPGSTYRIDTGIPTGGAVTMDGWVEMQL